MLGSHATGMVVFIELYDDPQFLEGHQPEQKNNCRIGRIGWKRILLCTDAELSRIFRYAEGMVNSRKDSDISNEKYVDSFGERYTQILRDLFSLFERIANATEATSKNIKEVEVY